MDDWIPSQVSLGNHPKLKRAARQLSVRRSELAGCLHFLWWWAVEYAPDGDLEDFEAEDLADAADWPGDPEQFVDALIGCGSKGGAGFLERVSGRLVIHDWDENQGDQFRARVKAAAKKRIQRANQASSEPSDENEAGDTVSKDGDSVSESGDTVPKSRDLTRTKDQTRPDQTKTHSFDSFWAAYPRKQDKGHARKAWVKATKTTPPKTILEGLERQRPSLCAKEAQFIPMPATWLNGERWTDEPEPKPGDRPPPDLAARRQRITFAKAQRDAGMDDELARGLVNDDLEWAEVIGGVR